MIWLHTYLGIISGWLLFVIFVTGTLSYFTPEITYWMMPERQVIVSDGFDRNIVVDKASHTQTKTQTNTQTKTKVAQESQQYQIEQSLNYLQQHAKSASSWRIYLPTAREQHWYVQWREGKTRHRVSFNKDATPFKSTTDTKGGLFFRNFHYTLQLRGYGGRYIAGIAAMAMLLTLFSGIYTHRRFFKDFFTLRKGKITKWTSDLHALVGIVTLPFCLMICISAIMIYAIMYMPFSANMHFEQGERGVNKAIIPSLPPLTNSANTAASSVKSSAASASENMLSKSIAYSAILTNLKAQWQEPHAIKRITVEAPGNENSRFIIERTKSLTVSNRADRLVYSSYTATPLEGYADESAPATFRRIMYGLHQANFATTGLRWLLFGLGVLSCVLIASGLIVWVNQRRTNLGKGQKRKPLSLHIMEKGNIAAIMGMAIATPVFLLANRLIPADTLNRANMEINAFFVAWLCCLLHAIFRPAKNAWFEQVLVAAVSYMGLAVVGICMPFDRTLNAFSTMDVTYLSFIIAFVLAGSGFAVLAHWLKGRLKGRLENPPMNNTVGKGGRP